MITGRIKFNTNTLRAELAKGIRRNAVPELQKRLNIIAAATTKKIQVAFREKLYNNEIIQKLFDPNHPVYGELGAVGIHDKIEYVLTTWITNTVVESKILTWTERGGLYGGFVFQMVKEGYDDVLSLNIAKFPSHQYIIPWLEWLLSSGNQRVLVEHYDFVEMPGEGRTRKGLMIEGAGRKYWTMPMIFRVHR